MTQGSGRGSRLPILFLALALLLVAAGTLLRATAPDPESLPAAEAQMPALQTFELRALQIQPRTEVAGLLEARRRVEIFAEEEGRVVEVGAAELENVEAGQLLLRLDPLRAELALERARAAVERASSQGSLARADLERRRGLAGRDVASRAALDEAENAARQAAAAGIEARASLVEAEDRLAKTIIRTPFAGTLRSFTVEEGEYVRRAERVAELLDVARLRLTLGLTDRQVVAVTPGDRARLKVEARPEEIFQGSVVRVGGAIDLATRKFPIRIEVPNPDGRLLPGMVARAALTLGEPRPILALPRDAVLEEFGLHYVYLVSRSQGDGSLVRKRRIQVGEIPFRPTELEVLDGLAPGQQIAVSSLRQLRDGMPVRPLPPSNTDAMNGFAEDRAETSR